MIVIEWRVYPNTTLYDLNEENNGFKQERAMKYSTKKPMQKMSTRKEMMGMFFGHYYTELWTESYSQI